MSWGSSNGGGNLLSKIATSLQAMQGPLVIDVDGAEALLVRADGDAGDVLTVNTSTAGVSSGGTLDAAGDLTVTGGASILVSANGGQCQITLAAAELTAISGASVTSSSLIPAGATVLSVCTKVTTAIGTGNGTTGYSVGDGVDPDRWGAIVGTADTTISNNTDWTADTTPPMFASANDVVLTATTGNFDGTGAIRIEIYYLIPSEPTS